jgi:hypothetical protein
MILVIKVNRSSLIFFTTMMVVILLLSSCIHVHHDKFGKENNEERKKIGLPVIKDSWRRDASFLYPAPENTTLWFTDSRPKDMTDPYHAYKRLYYTGDTLVAERDTYLNPNLKWFKSFQINNSVDTLERTFKNYHALDITYVYKPLRTKEKDFSAFKTGFIYEIQGIKDSFSDVQTLTVKQADEILKGWNLKRLNY